ncbi:unnamed protein product, partial [Didymodactylos carnosus]
MSEYRVAVYFGISKHSYILITEHRIKFRVHFNLISTSSVRRLTYIPITPIHKNLNPRPNDNKSTTKTETPLLRDIYPKFPSAPPM